MTERRSFLGMLGAGLAALLAPFHRRRAPRFPEHTPPGNRYRTFALGDRPLHLREDLFASGWIAELRFHDGRKEER